MNHVHIKCRTPARPDGTHPMIQMLPSIVDCEVEIDGQPVHNVESITWTVVGAEPARATITFFNATVDVDAVSHGPRGACVECGNDFAEGYCPHSASERAGL